jgi:hypothetical protein
METRILYGLKNVEAEDCFKMPVTVYQLVQRYIPEYMNPYQGGCKAEVMRKRRIRVSSE